MSDLAPEAVQRLFDGLIEQLVRPRLEERIALGEVPEGTVVYRFQILMRPDAPVEVRLNEEVRGTVIAKKVEGKAFADGEVVTVDDILGIEKFERAAEDDDIPHLTGLLHRDGWSLAFDLRSGHERRHVFLERGTEFLATAKEAAAAERLGAFVDTAYSAAELFAKAELLASQPTVELVAGKTSHGRIESSYHAWSALGNTEPRFAKLLSRLHKLRSSGRYAEGDLDINGWGLVAILSTLDDHRDHVARALAPDRYGDGGESDTQYFIAKRPLRAGELVLTSDVTIFPSAAKPPVV
jgi:hypothetical protein